MSLRAYQQTSARAETPRETEYRLFGQVTRALMEAAETDASNIAARINALDWNRRLWTALANDCSLPGNQLPAELRANIISLSLWVSRHSSAIMRNEEEFRPLIDVNKAIMQGLRLKTEASAA